jgi:DNA polymerase-3 subunit delta'
MSAEDAFEIPHPRETTVLSGHEDAEAGLLDAFRSGRMPHAWLIGGPRGIGKATLAWRVARFVLAHGDPMSAEVQNATSLDVPEDHPVARQIAAQTHGGVLSLERTAGDSGTLRTVITVDQVRETVPFFGSTAAAAGWRVCIVDSVDELKWPEAPNALLKILEEPPPRALFLLVSHAPARVLATIQSRCRKLLLRPLSDEQTGKAAAVVAGRSPADAVIREAAAAAEGSVARALMLLEGEALGVHKRIAGLLEALPQTNMRELHALGDQVGGTDRASFTVLVDAIDRWLSQRLRAEPVDLPRLAKVSEVWEKLSRAARETESFNLDRKPFVFSAFGLLADVAR